MSTLRAAYRAASPPPYDPDWHPLDGLDGVVLDGKDVGQKHRERVRTQADVVRAREMAEERLDGGR